MNGKTKNIIIGIVGVLVVGLGAFFAIRHFRAPTASIEPETDPGASITLDYTTDEFTYNFLDDYETLSDLSGTETTVAGGTQVNTTKKATTTKKASTTKKATTTAKPGTIVNGAKDDKGNEVTVRNDGSVGIVKPDGSIAASYSYDETGDYFYTDNDPWQRQVGFNKLYDIGAAYVVMYYDTVRFKFTYNNLDWMVQMWKGQYGLLFIGGEIGLYYKNTSTLTEHYNCAESDKEINMQLTLYRDGVSDPLFTRPYAKHWWVTGFVPGKLKSFADRSELKVVAKLEMKDEAMRKAFCKALDGNGFSYVSNININKTEKYTYRGNVVDLVWQYMDQDKKVTTSKTTAAATTTKAPTTATPTTAAPQTAAPTAATVPPTTAPTTAAPTAAPQTAAPSNADV